MRWSGGELYQRTGLPAGLPGRVIRMKEALAFAYGVLAYLLFLFSFLYSIGFVGNLVVPKSIDSGPQSSFRRALLVDTCLLGLFALQHSVMARQGFKKWWKKITPAPIERSTYVLVSSLLLLLIYWQWRPIPSVLWEIRYPAGRFLLEGLFALGWLLVLVSTFLIDHFDLFGLRQVYLHLRSRPYSPPPFKMVGFYRHVRHPIMLGFVIAFWATPAMTAGHALFSLLATSYILVGIQLEERDLVRFYGDAYHQYQKRIPMVFPFWKRR